MGAGHHRTVTRCSSTQGYCRWSSDGMNKAPLFYSDCVMEPSCADYIGKCFMPEWVRLDRTCLEAELLLKRTEIGGEKKMLYLQWCCKWPEIRCGGFAFGGSEVAVFHFWASGGQGWGLRGRDSQAQQSHPEWLSETCGLHPSTPEALETHSMCIFR